MSKRVVVTLLDGIEKLTPLLDQLPEVTYDLIPASQDNLSVVLEKNLPSVSSDPEASFVIVLSKESYAAEERDRRVAESLPAVGIKAEPVFLVAGRDFTWEEIDRIIQRNNLFFVIPPDEETSAGGHARIFRGFVDKALLDYSINKKLIDLISTEFKSFIEQEELRSSKEEVEQLNMELETQNKVDELTKLLNRKGILEYFQMAKGRATRERWRLKAQTLQVHDEAAEEHDEAAEDLEDYFGHLSCMMIDIDDFKSVNDTYGHLVGDTVLRGLGSLFNVEGIFRSEDMCGRFGGEEFIIILPATSAEHARIPAEKMRQAIKKKTFYSLDNEAFRITISIGLAELEESEETIDELINKADIALYEAKQTGKDKTVLYEARMSPEVLRQNTT